MSDYKYVGSELDLFSEVGNWKSYWSSQLRPFLKGDVLEVGAGIGSNTHYLETPGPGRWVQLEPDPDLARHLTRPSTGDQLNRSYEAVCGTLEALRGQLFDAIVYVDVLEHIEYDMAELGRAATHLKPGGYLIVLSPAHQRLFSPFDAAIGHYRRYNKSMLQAISPLGIKLLRLRYLDSVGLLLSAANMLLLRQDMPTKGQLAFWNRIVIPISLVLDRLLIYSIGKTIIAIWEAPKMEIID